MVMFLIISCQKNPVRIIDHKMPNVKTDFTPFENAGCKSITQDEYDCGRESLLLEFGCARIVRQDWLGGLTPNYPIAGCYNFFEIDNGADSPKLSSECITFDPNMYGVDCNRLVIYKDGNFLVIKNLDELRNLFAPIDSPEEALSLALAGTDNYAEYGLTYNPDYVYYVQELEETYVETLANEYMVHLFHISRISCGPFDTVTIDVRVTRDGQMEEVNLTRIYRDPSEDSTCYD